MPKYTRERSNTQGLRGHDDEECMLFGERARTSRTSGASPVEFDRLQTEVPASKGGV